MNPVSRRRFLTAAASSAGILALRCNDDGATRLPITGTPTLGPVKQGGTFRLATTAPALSIDPHTEVTMGLAYICFLYGYLLHEVQQEEGAPVMYYDHAESFEQPDPLTYVFRMRPGIRFQNVAPANGREVVAEDVTYSFKRIASGDSTVFWTSGIAEMTAPDKSTFYIRLSEPYAYTMAELGGIRTAIVAPEAVEQFGDLKLHAAGSGPFQVGSLSPNEGIDMVRNPDYYVSGIPYIDTMSWRTFADDASIQAAFKAQQVDVYGPPSKLQADTVGAFDGVAMDKYPSLVVTMINLNEIKKPELQDQRIREALDLSLDRDQMIEKLCLGEGNYTGPVSWGYEYWSLPQDELRTRYKRDVNKARQLLEAAGAADLTLELKVVAAAADLAAMIRQHAAEAGININIRSMELGSWIADLFSQNFELMAGAGLPYGDENLPLQFNHTKNWTRKQNPVHLPDPEIDNLLDDILRAVDVAERHDLVMDVTRKIIDRHGPFLYLFAPYAWTARWDYVRGYEDVEPAMIAYTYDMWLDK